MTQVTQTCGPAPLFQQGCQGWGAPGLPWTDEQRLPQKQIVKVTATGGVFPPPGPTSL